MPVLLVDTIAPVQWEQWPARIVPPEVAVFRYQLREADQSWLYTLLQPDEHERASRFRQVLDRHRFIAGRGWLRFLISQLAGQPVQQIQLKTGLAGKPEPVQPNGSDFGWHINVSHAGEWVLLAVGYLPVGVDVEWINPRFAFQDLIDTSFNADDRTCLTNSADPRDLFYTLWTRKESLFKATGQGLTNDFMTISVSKGVNQVRDGLPAGPGTWSIRSFLVTTGYIGAVACQESTLPVRFFTLDAASPGFLFSAFDHQ